MVGQNPKNQMPKIYTFYILYDVIEYICTKKYTSQHIKKSKYIKNLIEMIFNLYDFFNIYQTL